MDCLVIINKNSGKGKILKKIDYIKDILSQKYDKIDVIFSERRGHITELAKENGDKYSTIVICGGDGSFHELINGIMACEKKCKVGYIPTGTVNDFAKSLKIPHSLKKCLKLITDGKTKKIDLIKNHDEYACYECGFGIFTSASYSVEQSKKKKLGALAYYIYSIKELFNSKTIPCNIETEKENYQENINLALIVNSRSVSGMKFNKNANLQDGKVDIFLFTGKSDKVRIRNILHIFKLFLFGVNSLRRDKGVKILQVAKIKISPLIDIHINVDGEMSKYGSVDVVVEKQAFEIFCSD